MRKWISTVAFPQVLDIGCSEMTFLQYLKSVPSLTDISLLDISEVSARNSTLSSPAVAM